MKVIETRYNGYLFRSRTEARWAVFFDALGVPWEYEPEGFELKAGWYLPDFRVRYPGSDGPTWFEVKGDLRDVDEETWRRLIEFSPTVLDGTPAMRMYLSPGAICGGDAPPLRARDHALREDRSGCALWSSKRRPWWDECENFFDWEINSDVITTLQYAIASARSARFDQK